YTYDSSARVLTRGVGIGVTFDTGNYTYAFDGGTLQTGYTDPLGNIWTHLTSGGLPTGKIDPHSNRETYVYQNCRPLYFVDALGRTTSFSYDSKGFMAVKIDPLQSRWTYTRDTNNNLTEKVDAL